MPIGTADTSPHDRKLILVASNSALHLFAAKAEIAKLRDDGKYSAKMQNYATFLDLFGRNSLAEKYERMTREEVIKSAEDKLSIGMPIYLFDLESARRTFQFGVGNVVKDGYVYFQHPVVTDMYVEPREFQKTLAKEKDAALRQLASSLGAKELQLISAEAFQRKGGSEIKVPILKAATELGLRIEVDSTGAAIKSVYSKYGKPRREPYVPADLQKWVDMDADLRTMVRDRIEGNLIHHRITIEHKEGNSGLRSVAASLAKKKLSASYNYDEQYHSLWHFEVEYWPVE